MSVLAMAGQAAVEVRKLAPSRGYQGYPSLFAADSEEEYSSDSHSDEEEQAPPSILPLEEEFRKTPQSLASLLEVLLPRIQPRAGVKGLSLQDQEAFSSVLVGELASQFSVIQHQVDDPFLKPHQNKQLHRLVVVQVCRIIQDLYERYTAKAARLGEGGIFSTSANLSRLKAELTVQANRSLNIPVIRRKVLDQLRGPPKPSRLPPITGHHTAKEAHQTTLDDLALDQPLRTKLLRFGVNLESSTIRRRVQRLKANIPEVVPGTHEADGDSEDDGALTCKTSSVHYRERGTLFRVSSLPELWRNFLLCDWGLTSPQPHNPTQLCLQKQGVAKERSKQQQLLGIHRAPSIESVMDLKLDVSGSMDQPEATQLGDYTLKELADDLRELSSQRQPQPSTASTTSMDDGVEDLHPLLQAHVHGLSEKRSQKLAEFDSAMRRKQHAESQMEVGRRPSNGDSSLLEHSIPSVPTLEQLPYLSIQHASGPVSYLSHDLIHAQSELRSATLVGSMPAFSRHSLAHEQGAGLSMVQVTDSRFTLSQSGGGSQLEMGQLSRVQLHSSDSGEEATYPQSGTRFDLLNSMHHLEHQGDERSQLEGSGTSAAWEEEEEEEGVTWLETRGNTQCSLDNTDTANMQASMLSFSHGNTGEGQQAREEGEELEEIKGEEEESLYPSQPAVMTTRAKGQGVIRTSDIRVSERTPVNSLTLKPFGPVYNELTGELDQASIDVLDSNLNQGKEITAVYQELMKTLSSDHLQFDKEPTLEPCLAHPVELSSILASDTLHHRRSQRIVNPTLHRPVSPPWGRGKDRKQWEQSNQYKGPDLKQLGISKMQLASSHLPPELAHLTRAYTSWLRWWRSTIDADDYLKFASREESDYLRLTYHLYDSDGSDSEAEQEEVERKRKLAALHARLVAKREKMDKLCQLKSGFKPGVWNVNIIMMGGLGGDPTMSSSSDEDETTTQQQTQSKHAVSTEGVQARLQRIWSRLHFPSGQQMDMAIKYSSQPLQLGSRIYNALTRWERACDLIEKREVLLSKLEAFEKRASDPGRFFAKGRRGSSVTRLDEARRRDKLHIELDKLDRSVSEVITKLQSQHGDTVTYKGRAYREKMMADRTEMLYWLQQERRQAVLKPALRTLSTEVVLPPAFVTQ